MRLLLDTHTLLWWLSEQPKLSATARNAISHDDAIVIVSAATAWEICTKVRIGKLPTAYAVCEDFRAVLAAVAPSGGGEGTSRTIAKNAAGSANIKPRTAPLD